MNFYKYSSIGSRIKNEDSLYVDIHKNTLFACIADGVGGLPHGDIASKYAVDKFENNITSKTKLSFKDFLIQTNSELELLAKNELKVDFIATTFSGLYANSKRIKGIHVGDSRIILIRNGIISNLTIDHSELGRLKRENLIGPDESKHYFRKNIIENILGIEKYFKYMEFDTEAAINDRLIISTDGFHDTISDEVILRISNKYRSLNEVHRGLVNEVENRVLRDNTSFICIEI